MPTTDLQAGETEHLATAESAGDAYYLNVTGNNAVRIARSRSAARRGRLVPSDKSGDFEATRSGEELWVHAESPTSVDYGLQGWTFSLFGRDIIPIDGDESRGEVPQDQARQSGTSTHFLYKQTGTTINSGDMETVVFTSPSGTYSRVIAMNLGVKAPVNATSGSHQFNVVSEKNRIDMMIGESNYNTKLQYAFQTWNSADVRQRPSTEDAQVKAARGVTYDSTNGLQFEYRNNTNTGTARKRNYKLWIERVAI